MNSGAVGSKRTVDSEKATTKFGQLTVQELEQGGQIAECQGVLVGGQPGKPSFGVWLDLKPKLLGLRG